MSREEAICIKCNVSEDVNMKQYLDPHWRCNFCDDYYCVDCAKLLAVECESGCAICIKCLDMGYIPKYVCGQVFSELYLKSKSLTQEIGDLRLEVKQLKDELYYKPSGEGFERAKQDFILLSGSPPLENLP